MASEERILLDLKTRGPQRAAALAEALGISATAVRQQLAGLAEASLVTHEDRRETPGRPKRYWRLTGAGHGRFPDTHSALTAELLRAARVVFGEEGLDRLIAEREGASEREYRRVLRGARGLGERLQRLAEVRAAEGYMAEAREEPDGSWLLVENHCPICAAASEYQGLCRSELELFRSVLGRKVSVEREDHILAGARRCAYRVR